VFGAARLRGPIARDVIAQTTGLSIATVNRQVTALLDAGVLRERADLAVSGAIGRPRVPVEVNHEPFLTLGIHIGARTTSIVATDLFGRTLDVVETPTPRGAQNSALAALAGSASRYLSRWHRRRPLWVGVAAGGVVDSATGHLDHARLGWTDAPVGPVLAETLGLPVSLASHVDAMAGAELLLGARRLSAPTATSLYVYARETVGYALSIGGRVHSPTSGPGTIAALPAQSQLLGGTGQLESTVSDEAVVTAARKLRIVPADGPSSTIAGVLRSARQGNQAAIELLGERARVLGEAVALLRDMLNPDDLVVGGQAFTEYPEGMAQVEAAYAQRSVLAPRDIRLTSFGNRVQEAGAGVVSLGGLYADPIAAMRRAVRDKTA
jgi:predicted NBD/HSP70 family sugar kinase